MIYLSRSAGAVVLFVLVMGSCASGWAQVSSPTAETHNQSSIASDSLHSLPEGEPDVVAVIAVGDFPLRPERVPVVIRNNTDEKVYNVELKVEYYDAEGALVGVGTQADGVYPGHLESGEITITSILPDVNVLPSGFTAEYLVSYDNRPGINENSVPLEFQNLTFFGDRLVGEVVNPYDSEVRSIWLNIVCMGSEGTLLGFAPDMGENVGIGDRISSGESVTFQMTMPGGQCEGYIVSANGWLD